MSSICRGSSGWPQKDKPSPIVTGRVCGLPNSGPYVYTTRNNGKSPAKSLPLYLTFALQSANLQGQAGGLSYLRICSEQLFDRAVELLGRNWLWKISVCSGI